MKHRNYGLVTTVTIIFILIAFFFSVCIYKQYQKMKSINTTQSEEVTATIEFIGLPDGQPFVSFYDSDNVFHTDVPLCNVTIEGNLKNVEKHYGDELEAIYNAELDKAFSMTHFIRKIGLFAGLLITYICIMALLAYKSRNNTKTK